jgi:superfamily II RNA helicase
MANRYIKCIEERKTSINKKRKELDKEIQNIQESYKMIDTDIKLVSCYNVKKCELLQLNLNKEKTNNYINNKIEIIFDFLIENDFLINNDTKTLTNGGKMASQIREAPCLVIGKLIENNSFTHLNAMDLCCLLSCFAGFNTTDNNYENSNLILKNIIEQTEKLCIKYEKFEINNYMDTGTNYEFNVNYIPYIIKWYNASNSQECTIVLGELKENENVFIGEFVKGIIKINNITNELEVIAEQIGDISLLNKLKDIHSNTLKFVATNQSLYI